jgi:hypothetical protein
MCRDALRSRRSSRWFTNLLSFLTPCLFSVLPSLVMRRIGMDFQRPRQRLASTQVCTASAAGKNDSTCCRTSSGRASILLHPLATGTGLRLPETVAWYFIMLNSWGAPAMGTG